jgi:adenosylmethionine---8-amino-7-oxononanoate aminotransferase
MCQCKRKRESNRTPSYDDYRYVHAKPAPLMLQVRSRLWLPFTQMQSFDRNARCFVEGSGNALVDAQGQRVYDAVSSIWTIIHGHGHPAIVDAIAHQASTLDHATALGATNPVAEELAHRLCTLASMDYAFFASDGASAVEAAIKMAVQFWQQSGEPQRRRFVRFSHAYHGDTTGAMSLSDIAVFKQRFGPITFETRPFDGDVSVLASSDVAAAIVEPIVQAAAGMRVVPIDRYDALRGCAPLVIVDEIATGFGRTGTMFACEQLGIVPDIMCLGKGITGGALALSATLVRERVYDAFLGAPEDARHFFHGHSYAGNPIACAAALASLRVFELERTLERTRAIAARTHARLQRLQEHEAVTEVRQAGAMAGIVVDSGGWTVANALYERGQFTRPLGNAIQFVPPLSSTDEEIDGFFDALEDVLA